MILYTTMMMAGLATLVSGSMLTTMDTSYDVEDEVGQLDLGLGPGRDVRCKEGSPRGEDGATYCSQITPQELLRMNKTASSKSRGHVRSGQGQLALPLLLTS